MENMFRNRKFVITGRLDYSTRDSYKNWIEDRGGILQSTITKTTDYLVTNHTFVHGEQGSKKLEKAKEMGIKIINEDELFEDIPKVIIKQYKIKILLG